MKAGDSVWIARAPGKWVRATFVAETQTGHLKCRDETGSMRWMLPDQVRQETPT